MSRPKTAEPEAPRHRHWTHAWRFLRWRQRPQSVPWGSILVVLLLALALPTLVDVLVGARYPRVIESLHYFVSTVYALTSLMILWEACAAWREALPCGEAAPPEPLPRCTAIVAAYLPNEQGIIGDTLGHLLTTLDVPPDALEIILAYNTPDPLPVEAELAAMAARDARLRLLCVPNSRSKAENVNAAVAEATGEIVAVFDADHQPAADCFRRAWRWLGSGYDMVQGRCVIRNDRESWLTRTVGVEFDTMYALSHQGRCGMSDTAIFGGSNGYWRRDALADTPMDPAMLTEDIDVSVRGLLSGFRLAHDRGIVSEELAPTRLTHWLFQRKRWSQGWLEVTLHHQRALLTTPHLTTGQKFLWFYTLAWGECFPLLSVQILPLILSARILGHPIHWFGNPYFLATSLLTLASGPFTLLLTYLRAGSLRRRQGLWYLFYGLVGLFYTSLKTLITLVAQYSHFLKDRQWVTTPR